MALPASALDHAVINVRDDMDQAVDTYRRLGFHMTDRGYHTLGSINHLAILEDDYLELIGFEKGAPSVRTDILRFPHGLNALVFGIETPAEVYAELQKLGVPSEPPIAFSRPVLLDGVSQDAKFQTVRLGPDTIASGRVYFCKHFTPHLVWRPEWKQHENGATGVARAVLVSENPAKASEIFRRMFGDAAIAASSAEGVTMNLPKLRVDITTRAGLTREFGDAVPSDDRADYMAALSIRTKSMTQAEAALRRGNVPHTRDGDKRIVVPASATMNVTLAFVPS